MCLPQCITTTNKLEPVLVVIFAQVALARFDTEMIITELTRIRNELVKLSKERRHKCSRHRRTRDLRRLSDELSEIIGEINLVSGRPTTASRLPDTSTDESECPRPWEVERTLGLLAANYNNRKRKTSRSRVASTYEREAPQAAIERSLGIVNDEIDQARKASRLRAASSDEGERRLAGIRKRVEDMENNAGQASNASRLRAASTDDSNLTNRPRYKVVFALPNGEYGTAYSREETPKPSSAPHGNRATDSFNPGEIIAVCEDDTSRESHSTDAE